MVEAVLDYIYGFNRDPRAEQDLSAEEAVGALWLAGRLEVTELQEQVVGHLESAVTEQNVHAYLSAAMGLGLVKVQESVTRLAAAGVEEITGACGGLPLEAMEGLLSAAEEGGAGTAGVRDRLLASYLRAYDESGRLDEEAFRRLMGRHSARAGRGGGEAAGRKEMVGMGKKSVRRNPGGCATDSELGDPVRAGPALLTPACAFFQTFMHDSVMLGEVYG